MLIQEHALAQLYGQLIDRAGQPVPGVGLVIVRTKDKVKAALANTVSDSNGAFVLTLTVSTTSGNRSSRNDATTSRETSTGTGIATSSTTLTHRNDTASAGRDDAKYELQLSVNDPPIPLPNVEMLGAGLHGPYTLVVRHRPPKGKVGVASRPILLASEAEICAAFKKSPGLFSRRVAAHPPDPCNPYMQTDIATRVFYLQKLVMFPPIRAMQPDARVIQPATGAVNFVDTTLSVMGNLHYGAIMEFRQEWWDFGYSLGDLLYSMPLAPCEETKIATVDWRRQDYAKRQTALDESHFQDTTISRNEIINEAVRMVSDKHITGITESGGGAITLGPGSGGYAKSVSDITEAVRASNDASRAINDNIRQVSNTLRNTRAFAVAETTQQEESVVRTRILRNHNHCHTVTFQYFEVLQHFLISTKPNNVRPAIFIPFIPIQFNPTLISRYGYLLRRALLDTTLEPVFDKLLGITQPQPTEASNSTALTTSSTSAIGEEGEITEIELSAVVMGGERMSMGTLQRQNYLLIINENAFNLFEKTKEDPLTGKKAVVTTVPPTGYSPQPIEPNKISEIQRVGIQFIGKTDVLSFDDLSIKAKMNTGEEKEIFYEPSLEIHKDRRFIERIQPGVLTTPMVTVPLDSGIARLVDHLNANRIYYTAAIIGGGDAGNRYLVLTQFTDGYGNNLTDIVDNTVAGTVGNYLAFPLRSQDYLPREFQGQVALPDEPDERLITMPTPGVFAESQLGSCSACEKIDDTRFWDWQQSPCPEEAPDITDAMLASRYQNLKDLVEVVKSELQPTPVQIPQQPEPMIKIGDETLKELAKGLDLANVADVLGFINGLAQIAAEGYKETLAAFKSKPGGPGSGSSGTGAGDAFSGDEAAPGDTGDMGAGSAAGGTEAATGAAAGEGLASTGAIIL